MVLHKAIRSPHSGYQYHTTIAVKELLLARRTKRRLTSQFVYTLNFRDLSFDNQLSLLARSACMSLRQKSCSNPQFPHGHNIVTLGENINKIAFCNMSFKVSWTILGIRDGKFKVLKFLTLQKF